MRDRRGWRPRALVSGLIGLHDQTSRTRIGVSQRSRQESRHRSTGHIRTRVVGRSQQAVVDTKVPQLNNGVFSCNSYRTGVDIGVVVSTAIAINVQRQGAVRLTTITGRCDVKHPLDEHGHLFTGDVVIRSEGRRRLTGGDSQLLDLVDSSLDLS